jgi:hypothetical protein
MVIWAERPDPILDLSGRINLGLFSHLFGQVDQLDPIYNMISNIIC